MRLCRGACVAPRAYVLEQRLRQRERRTLTQRGRRGVHRVHEPERVAVAPGPKQPWSEIDLDELAYLRPSAGHELRRMCRGLLDANLIRAIEAAAQAGSEDAAFRSRARPEAEESRPNDELDARAARDRSAGRPVESFSHARRCTWNPSSSRWRPWVPVDTGGGSVTRRRLMITNPKLSALSTNTHDGPVLAKMAAPMTGRSPATRSSARSSGRWRRTGPRGARGSAPPR